MSMGNNTKNALLDELANRRSEYQQLIGRIDNKALFIATIAAVLANLIISYKGGGEPLNQSVLMVVCFFCALVVTCCIIVVFPRSGNKKGLGASINDIAAFNIASQARSHVKNRPEEDRIDDEINHLWVLAKIYATKIRWLRISIMIISLEIIVLTYLIFGQ